MPSTPGCSDDPAAKPRPRPAAAPKRAEEDDVSSSLKAALENERAKTRSLEREIEGYQDISREAASSPTTGKAAVRSGITG